MTERRIIENSSTETEEEQKEQENNDLDGNETDEDVKFSFDRDDVRCQLCELCSRYILQFRNRWKCLDVLLEHCREQLAKLNKWAIFCNVNQKRIEINYEENEEDGVFETWLADFRREACATRGHA